MAERERWPRWMHGHLEERKYQPHYCNESNCPGHLNARKLDAYEPLRKTLETSRDQHHERQRFTFTNRWVGTGICNDCGKQWPCLDYKRADEALAACPSEGE